MVRAFTVPGEPKGKGRPRFNPMNPAAHPKDTGSHAGV